MSTYLIASAIEKFANDFKEVNKEKNKIERERLEFEKEKFEFNKKQLSLNEPDTEKRYGYEARCQHDWVYDCSVVDMLGRKERHRCRLCGEFKTVETAITLKT